MQTDESQQKPDKNEILFSYRNLSVTEPELMKIRKILSRERESGRCEISRVVCRTLGWRQPNGLLKDGVCRTMLVQMEKEELVTLPPRKRTPNNPSLFKNKPEPVHLEPLPAGGWSSNNFSVFMVKKQTADEAIYKAAVNEYSGRGYVKPVGENIKYLVKTSDGEYVIACIGFSSAPRHIRCRDEYIG
ncbi:MAG: hypothetical protein CSYNP_03987 [Syntrophus sp. SKADARSKE-3]|nr:hypothetical protein [Syntrophus sp. SKADARSKE-3]